MKQAIAIARLEDTPFYAMDKAIKSYRQFAQSNIRVNNMDITIDQWLVLKTVSDHPDMTQKEMAQKVFKDHASITRIIEILVKRDYLTRSFNDEDRRRYKLRLTKKGSRIYENLMPIVQYNRSTALNGISDQEISDLRRILNKIIHNCSREN